MGGNTIIEISPLIQSARVQLNETCMALQSCQWALVHLNLLDKQLTELGMANAKDIMNGTAPTPSEKR
jgi:hypothetical protein